MDVLLLFVSVVGLMLIGVPIAVSLGLSSIIFLLVLSDTSLASVAQSFFQAMAGLGFNQVLPFFLKLRLGWGATEFGNWMGWNCMRPIRLYSRSVIYDISVAALTW